MKKKYCFCWRVYYFLIGGMFTAIASQCVLSMAVDGIMSVIVILGFVFGVLPLLRYIGAFKQGVKQLDDIKKINSDNRLLPLSEIKPFFGQSHAGRSF